MRFMQTVAYFNEWRPDKLLASLAQRWAPETASPAADVVLPLVPEHQPLAPDTSINIPVDGVILVTGATGGVGKRVVARLLAAGKQVRALVRDVEKAREMLADLPVAAGGRLEVVAADLSQRQTLLPEMFEGVRAVVSCSAVKVQPKEGDTLDRKKYYQGIQFYDPEVVDTPQLVEAGGMANLLALVRDSLGLEDGVMLLQSTPSASQSAASASSSSSSSSQLPASMQLPAPVPPQMAWGALDDVVMGGVSRSGFALEQGAGEGGRPAWVFSGLVSTDNFGGFASVRTRNLVPPLDLAPYAGLEIRLLGDGQRYKFILRPDANWDGIAYCCSFDTQPGVWQTVRLPFTDFFPVFRARRLSSALNGSGPAPTLDPSSISSLQLMLSKFEYDGQLNPSFRRGAFRLPIDHIAAYAPAALPPRFVHVSSAGVTRPNRPGINVDMEPPAVKLNDMLGGLLTWKLAAEDILRSSGVPYAIVRPVALTEEPRGMPVEIDQGDVIKGKIGREDVSELCCALLGEPSANGTSFEIKSTVPFSQPWTVEQAAASPSGSGPREWNALVRASGLKRGVTGRTVDGVYTGRQTEEEALAAARAAGGGNDNGNNGTAVVEAATTAA